MSHTERLIAAIDGCGDFVTLGDGHVYYDPGPGRGALSARDLRALADELDRRNAAWDARLRHELGGEG